MFEYYAYHTRILSEIRLRLPQSKFGEKSSEDHQPVYIRLGSVPESKKPGADCAVGRVDGVLRVSVQAGRVITIEPTSHSDGNLELIRSIAQSELIAAALRQRGLLVLHASCVANESGAIAFVGFSGWGKSTLAIRFLREGYRLLSDDVLPICTRKCPPLAYPSHPFVKAKEDTLAKSNKNREKWPKDRFSGKSEVPFIEEFSNQKRKMKKAYIIEEEFREENEVCAMKKTEQIFEIMKHTWANSLISSPKHKKEHLKMSKKLSKKVDLKVLRRKKSMEDMSSVLEVVKKDTN